MNLKQKIIIIAQKKYLFIHAQIKKQLKNNIKIKILNKQNIVK
jgi:hypothetical protein